MEQLIQMIQKATEAMGLKLDLNGLDLPAILGKLGDVNSLKGELMNQLGSKFGLDNDIVKNLLSKVDLGSLDLKAMQNFDLSKFNFDDVTKLVGMAGVAGIGGDLLKNMSGDPMHSAQEALGKIMHMGDNSNSVAESASTDVSAHSLENVDVVSDPSSEISMDAISQDESMMKESMDSNTNIEIPENTTDTVAMTDNNPLGMASETAVDSGLDSEGVLVESDLPAMESSPKEAVIDNGEMMVDKVSETMMPEEATNSNVEESLESTMEGVTSEVPMDSSNVELPTTIDESVSMNSETLDESMNPMDKLAQDIKDVEGKVMDGVDQVSTKKEEAHGLVEEAEGIIGAIKGFFGK